MSEAEIEETAEEVVPVRKVRAVRKPKVDFDLDVIAKEVAAEDDTKPFTFKFDGRNWTMRPAGTSDAKLLTNTEVTDTQSVMLYLKDLLGDEQWAEFPRINLTVALKLIDAYMVFTTAPASESAVS